MQHLDTIEKIRNGNLKDLKILYRYYPVIKKWLIGKGCSKDQTMDIFQEALVVFCDKCNQPDFHLTSSIDTYLFAVSRNIFLSQTRVESRFPTTDLNDMDQAVEDDLQQWKEKEQRLEYVFQALSMIAEKCRTILQMFYLHRKSMNEIADKMGFRTVQVAKNRKFKCLMYARDKAFHLLNEK